MFYVVSLLMICKNGCDNITILKFRVHQCFTEDQRKQFDLKMRGAVSLAFEGRS